MFIGVNMDAYTYKCSGCGASLEYDASQGLLVCRTCGQYYRLEYTNTSAPDSNIIDGKSIFDEYDNNDEQDALMDIRVYHCSSCGAEVMTTDVDVSSFCSYCGQSTIMFDRISKEKKPSKIIPFKLSKEEALMRAKAKFVSGKYSFTDIAEVTIDTVKGIYMPYWVYSCNASVDATIKVDNKKDGQRTFSQSKDFDELVALDASRRFNDKISIELNPYILDKAEQFDMSYLAGFYADKSDVDNTNREEDAKKYVLEELKQRILDATPGVQPRHVREMYSGGIYDYRRYVEYNAKSSDFSCSKSIYMFFPVYFITFMVEDKKVIIIVNGQTGKVVGFVPFNMKKLKKAQIKSMLILGPIFAVIGAIFFRYTPFIWALLFIGIITSSTLNVSTTKKKKFIAYYNEMNSKEMFDLIKRD